jgi:hypothetical protein
MGTLSTLPTKDSAMATSRSDWFNHALHSSASTLRQLPDHDSCLRRNRLLVNWDVTRCYSSPTNAAFRHIAFAIALLSFVGCATPWRGPHTSTDSVGHTVCALHHTPLTTERVFVVHGCWLEVEAYARIRARYPNPWPAGFSRTRVPNLPMRRTTLTYCQRCTDDYDAEIKRRGM